MSKQAGKKVVPLTKAQQLGSIIKSARDIMRKDKGLNGDLDRLPMLTWIMFLKFLDDMEEREKQKAQMKGHKFRPAIVAPYRWRDWAAKADGISGDDLIAFINNEKFTFPDGSEGKGLFTYLRGLQGENGGDRRDVISTVFKGVTNRMVSGYLLRDVINKINGIHFNSSEEINTLSNLYESMLKEMRDAAGDSGEFYTPRPVVRFMVEVTNPRLGDTVLDPACGTGGFLVETFVHLQKQCKTVKEKQTLEKNSIFGGEAKTLPYMLAQMNLLLHGLESPQINPDNSLKVSLRDITDKDRVDIILTNPPFGGEEERGILKNFPDDRRTAETALLFFQLIMHKLKREPRPGRAAVVVPNGTLFGDGIAARIKEDLLTKFNLHTIVRLPSGVFAPYTSITTNLMFFDRSGPTKEIWYYELPLPEGKKSYSKTAPIQYEHFASCIAWWNNREENEYSWKIDFKAIYEQKRADAKPHWDAADRADEAAREYNRAAKELTDEIEKLEKSQKSSKPPSKERADVKRRIDNLVSRRELTWESERQQRAIEKEERSRGNTIYWPIFNLDIKNPSSINETQYPPPSQLADSILIKEQRIADIIKEIKDSLGGAIHA